MVRICKFSRTPRSRSRQLFSKSCLDLERGVLENLQIRTIDLDCERALQPCQGLIHRVFCRLREVKNDARETYQLAVDGFDELCFVSDRPGLPRLIAVRFQAHIELTVKKTCRICPVIRASKF